MIVKMFSALPGAVGAFPEAFFDVEQVALLYR